MHADTTHHARLSIDDLNDVARSLRQQAMRGDKTTCAIAGALESVVRQRRATEMARERARASRFRWAPLRRAASWAISLY